MARSTIILPGKIFTARMLVARIQTTQPMLIKILISSTNIRSSYTNICNIRINRWVNRNLIKCSTITPITKWLLSNRMILETFHKQGKVIVLTCLLECMRHPENITSWKALKIKVSQVIKDAQAKVRYHG